MKRTSPQGSHEGIENHDLSWIDRPPVRRYVYAVTIAALLWVVLAWILSAQRIESQVRHSIEAAQKAHAQSMSDISSGLERSIILFYGVPAVIGRDGSVLRALNTNLPAMPDPKWTPAQRRECWLKLPALAAVNRSLADSVEDIRALSVIWVMNASGDCVAASNSEARESFVGINYRDREYFQEAMEGHPGSQFAVGRMTGVPGLFFSAPVMNGKRILGVVAGKIDLSYLASWVNQANAFITDRYGVIILAQDRRIEMLALPNAAVRQLDEQGCMQRYRQVEIPELSIEAWGPSPMQGLYRLNNENTPLLLASRMVPGEELTVTVLQAVPGVRTQKQDQHELFALAAIVGCVLLSLGAGALYFVNNHQSVKRYRAHRREIEYMARHDALTGLFSRAVIDPMISQGIARAARSGRRFGVLFLDMDMFKNINDSMGHETGDLVLQEVAVRLRGAVRASDAVIRHGGDEFVILVHDIDAPGDVAHLAEKILAALSTPCTVHDVTLNLSASMGVAFYPDDGDGTSMLLRNADSALFRAKESGRADFRFYHASMNSDTMAHLALENELRQALEKGQFVVHYQPQFSRREGRIIGCEALVRWRHPERGLLLPGAFIPAMEQSGLIVPMGEWVLQEACRQAFLWRQSDLIDFPVAVNVSAFQFRKPTLVAVVQGALEASGLPAQGLELELTESVLMENTGEAIHILRALKGLGVCLAIDDFGTGYSSLAYLKRFEPDVLKIDRSFVQHIDTDPNDLAIVSAIISLARSLNYRVIAEGMETESQMLHLSQLGCDDMQGNWFSLPLPAEAFADFVSRTPLAAACR